MNDFRFSMHDIPDALHQSIFHQPPFLYKVVGGKTGSGMSFLAAGLYWSLGICFGFRTSNLKFSSRGFFTSSCFGALPKAVLEGSKEWI
jgi:hypothetical protein